MRSSTRLLLPLLIIALMMGLLWVTGEVYVVGFGLGRFGTRIVHASAILFGLLFLFSFASSKLRMAWRFRILFKLFNALVALVFYLFPLSVALSIALALFPFSPNGSVYLSTIALVIAGALGGIGILQARFLRVVRYNISLPKAPASWNGKTAALVSDTHFGLIRNTRFSKRIVQKIRSLAPAFILHSGDFYDGPTTDTTSIIEPWKALARDIPMFYAPGNHEHYGDFKGFISSIRESGIRVLIDEVTMYEGVQIAGIDYRDAAHKNDAARAITALPLDPATPSILINHIPLFHPPVQEKGFSLMVSGHTHRGQFWPINYIVRIIFGKYTYGLHRVNTLEALTTKGAGTAGPPLRLFNTGELVVITFQTENKQ